jgi:dipeptidyl aminopeptidase/acylaminoacyl peptidase
MRSTVRLSLGRVVRRTAAIIAVVAIFAGTYLGACWYIVGTMVTLNPRVETFKPNQLGFSQANKVTFHTADGVRLEGWFVPSRGDRVIILVHGVYSNAWDCQAPDIVRAYHDAGFNVFLFDSRGQGESGGTLGLGWLERQDVHAVVNILLGRGFKAGKIGIHGTSYGGASALLAAAEIPEIGAVVSDSAFADVQDVMLGEIARKTGLSVRWTRPLVPGLRFVAWLGYDINFDEPSPERAIAAIAPRPVLLIHGERDSIVPVESVERLHQAAPTNTSVWVLPGQEHTQGVRLVPDCERPSPLREQFLSRVTEFFRDTL